MSTGFYSTPTPMMPALPVGSSNTVAKSAVQLPAIPTMATMPTGESTAIAPLSRPAMPSLPSFPTAGSPAVFSILTSQPLQPLPTHFAQENVIPIFDQPAPVATQPLKTTAPVTPAIQPPALAPQSATAQGSTDQNETAAALPPLQRDEPRVDYTDSELLNCLHPMIQDAVTKALFKPDGGMDTYFEPMLRATIRRALAEHSPDQAPFIEPGFFDRCAWRLRALFSSRNYEEIFFEKTKRFRVEEVYLLDKNHLGMISYASSDPARHASAKRVHSTVRRIADGALDKEGTIRLFFDLPEGRHAVVREGKTSLLVAIILGAPNEALRVDLDYTLNRIEDRYAARYENYDAPLLLSIQPQLEDCLLICAPSSHMI